MTTPTNSQLRLALDRYSTALALRAASTRSLELVTLDDYFRTSLPALLQSRPTPYLTTHELGELMRWKLARGKWRPRLLDFALSNPDDVVQATTRLASSQIPAKAIATLSTLHGIGPATSSAILSLFRPLTEPFFSDEAVEAVGMGKATYTVKALNQYRELMQERLEEGKWESMEELERACWSWITLRNLEKDDDAVEPVGKGKAKKAVKESEVIAEEDGATRAVKGTSRKTRVAKTPYDRAAKKVDSP